MMRPRKTEAVLEVVKKATVTAPSGLGEKTGVSKAIATPEKEMDSISIINGSASGGSSVTDVAPAPNSTEGPTYGLEGSKPRDATLSLIETEKITALIKAWEENERSKAESKAIKKLSSITYWENSKKANVEAKIKKTEEAYEKEKAYHIGKLMNEVATIHKEAEEKRALVESRRSQEVLRAEDMAEQCRSTNQLPPKKIFGFLGS